MKTILMKSQLFHHSPPIIHNKYNTTPKHSSSFSFSSFSPAFSGNRIRNPLNLSAKTQFWLIKSHQEEEISPKFTSIDDSGEEFRKRRLQVITGVASIGFLLLFMGQDKAWALGPEGPLVEEFWENVRRYALYALTVSTGVIYAVLQPIFELLKNPISAILILLIIGGSFFIVSQILSAMVGVSEFPYEYAY